MKRAYLLLLLASGPACTADYVSTRGTTYPAGAGAEENALLESARYDLSCPTEPLRVWGHWLYHSETIYFAEGCGFRSSYVLDCPSPQLSHASSVREIFPNVPPQPVDSPPPICAFILMSRVQLATATPPPPIVSTPPPTP